LADVFADHAREIDLVEIQPELPRHDLGGHCLPRPRGPREEGGEAFAERQLPIEAPCLEHVRAVARLIADLAELPDRVGGEHEIAPGVMRFYLLRQIAQLAARPRAAARIELLDRELRAPGAPPS